MIQPQQISWEPISEGIQLWINDQPQADALVFHMPMTTVRELAADMEEANFLSRGYDKVDCMVSEVDHGDLIVLGGNSYKIHDLLKEREDLWVIQFDLNEHYEANDTEIHLPPDLQVTVWRPTE